MQEDLVVVQWLPLCQRMNVLIFIHNILFTYFSKHCFSSKIITNAQNKNHRITANDENLEYEKH